MAPVRPKARPPAGCGAPASMPAPMPASVVRRRSWSRQADCAARPAGEMHRSRNRDYSWSAPAPSCAMRRAAGFLRLSISEKAGVLLALGQCRDRRSALSCGRSSHTFHHRFRQRCGRCWGGRCPWRTSSACFCRCRWCRAKQRSHPGRLWPRRPRSRAPRHKRHLRSLWWCYSPR